MGPSLIMVPLETFPFSPSLQFVSLFARVVNICNIDEGVCIISGLLTVNCLNNQNKYFGLTGRTCASIFYCLCNTTTLRRTLLTSSQ